MNCSQKDVCILHLSDLHITEDAKDINGMSALPFVFDRLLKDIQKNTKNIDELIIVVSGDITYQARYQDYSQAIITFFLKLKENIHSIIREIIFVPGNHDVVRGNYETNVALMNGSDKEFIGFSGYKCYISTTNSIREMFGLEKRDISFGIQIVECADFNCCFIALDTAWSTTKMDDCNLGEIQIGKCQFEFLYQQYRSILPNDKVDITLLVSHYPLSWIVPDEREKMLSSMMDESKLNTDLILCGHIHNVEAINYSNHEHSLMTLITGIGWPQTATDSDKIERRYSIYKINPSRNTCDIIMRKSNRGLDFDFDYSVYTESRETDCKKIVYPFRPTHKNLAFVKVNAPDSIDEQNIYISPKVVEQIQKISNSLADLRGHFPAMLQRYKDAFFDLFTISFDSQQEIKSIKKFVNFADGVRDDEIYEYVCDKIEQYLYDNDEDLAPELLKYWRTFCSSNDNGTFSAFLYEICQLIIDDLSVCFPSDALFRAHFRRHSGNIKNDKYIAVCCEDNTNDPPEQFPKDLPWGGLVKAAFENGTSLVYSANRKLNNISTDWQDFITIIPYFEKSILEMRDSKHKVCKRPAITFGISIKKTTAPVEAVSAMSIIDFLKLEEHISKQLDEYVRLFGLPINQ